MTKHPLAKAIDDLHDARYISVDDKQSYCDLVQDLATECAYHLEALGITWQKIADNAHGLTADSIERALTGAVWDYRNNHK